MNGIDAGVVDRGRRVASRAGLGPADVLERRRLELLRELVGDVRGLDLAVLGAPDARLPRLFPDARLTLVARSREAVAALRPALGGYDVAFVVAELADLPERAFDRIVGPALERDHLPAVARVLRPFGVAVVRDRFGERLEDAPASRCFRLADRHAGWARLVRCR